MNKATQLQPATAPRPLRVVLAGNPNSGKTSLFNALTGARQKVGNYPGVTVEKRDGRWRDPERGDVTVRDLPGTYSLTTHSPEERIARDELLSGEYDVVVVVADSTVLSRSLMFLLQVMQLQRNVVLALNMSDEAARAGLELDHQELERLLGIPIVATTAHRGRGVAELKAAVTAAAARPPRGVSREVAADLAQGGHGRPSVDEDGVVRMQRYAAAVERILAAAVRKPARADARTFSDRIDRIVAHRLLGLPIFLAVMYAVFWMTFTVGAAPMDWIDAGVGWLGTEVTAHWPGSADSPLLSLLVDGIIAGVGGVIIFLPNIVLLFLGLSLLEDTGYMARAAYLMDRVLNRVGLHGKSFLPLVTGFGCSIPGIMATRTIDNDRDRLATMLVLPLMSCGARLPIWLLLIPALFPAAWQAPMMWGVYVFGIVLAMVLSLVLRGTLLRGEPAPFVLELPPYRLPTLKSVIGRMGERSWVYLRKAGTVILGISILLWALTSYPQPDTHEVDRAVAAGADYTAEQIEALRASEAMEHSLAGRVGRALEPVFAPLGYDWRIVTASLGAFAAKEVFVSQMNIVYALGEAGEVGDLGARLQADYSPLIGISLIVFLLVGTPCMATVAVTRRESGQWRWAWLQFFGLTALAYLLALFVYQVGRLIA
ncbi:ferrous iron transport protein B [bacterium]|nr:ferrous iron transport protein B [bacterium]